MSDYFDETSGIISANSLAKSSQINGLRAELGVAFDKLPASNLIATGAVTYGTDSGVANAYVVTLPVAATAYSVGTTISFKVNNENTGASTINVDGLGVKPIKDVDGNDLASGVLKTTGVNIFTYTGSVFVLSGVTSTIIEGLTNIATTARDEAVSAKNSADDDATQTAADRVQTGLDAVATAADRAQTGLDVTSTENNVSAAASSATLAESWASEAEDVIVSGGEYSAKHYSIKAAAAAASVEDPLKPLFSIKTANYTASTTDQIMADTSSSAWTMTLPASPSVGDYIIFADYAGTFATNNLTIARNGSNIMADASDLVCNVNYFSGKITYIDATKGWVLV